MNDRQLLEAAAKAAGMEVVGPAPKYIAQGCNEHALIVRNDRGGDSVFDPLTLDGDALRLAVKLRLSSTTDEVWVISHSSIAEYERDPYAATRRAITRAAAKLGEDLTG